MRAFAILSILLLHLYVPAGPYLNVPFLWMDRVARNLTSGVDLFFVLSGFLLFSHLKAKPLTGANLLAYAKKRALRILPAYYVALAGAAYYVYELIQSLERVGRIEMAERLSHSLASFPADLLFISNYTSDRLLEPGWSLSVEVHFYLVLPIFVYALQRRERFRSFVLPALLALFAIPSLLRLLQSDNAGLYFFTHTRFDALVAGMIVAELSSARMWKYGTAVVALVSVFLLVSAHLCEIEGWFYRTFRYTFFAVGYAGLLYLALMSSVMGRLLSGSLWRFVARISYSLYLWHPILLTAALRNTGVQVSSPFYYVLFAWIVAVLFSFAGSAALYLLFEWPFLVARRPEKERFA